MAGDWQLKMLLFSFWVHFGSTLEVFGWISGTIGFTLGAHWVQLCYFGAAGVTLGDFKLHFGRTWKLLGSVSRSLDVTLDASGMQIGCCRLSG